MDKAVARVRGAVERGEKIAVFGDYDVDGSTSAAILKGYLTSVGTPPRIYIPDRMTEGYGPNTAALLKLKGEGRRSLSPSIAAQEPLRRWPPRAMQVSTSSFSITMPSKVPRRQWRM